MPNGSITGRSISLPGAANADAGIREGIIVSTAAEFSERPVIFALSNPFFKVVCPASEACTRTDGRADFAGGRPFDPVMTGEQILLPGQGGDACAWPVIGLATWSSTASVCWTKCSSVSPRWRKSLAPWALRGCPDSTI
jgi:malic enzyme